MSGAKLQFFVLALLDNDVDNDVFRGILIIAKARWARKATRAEVVRFFSVQLSRGRTRSLPLSSVGLLGRQQDTQANAFRIP